jgi:subtilisin family serine protease
MTSDQKGNHVATRAGLVMRFLGCFALASGVFVGCSAGEQTFDSGSGEPQGLDPNANVGSGVRLSASASTTIAQAAAPRVVKDQYIVVFKALSSTGTQASSVADLSAELERAHGGTTLRRYQHALRGVSMRIPAAALANLKADPRVHYVVPDGIVTMHEVVTWGKDRIDQRQLPLNQQYVPPGRGAGVHAYVIDSGIRATHTEFQGRVGAGVDFFNGDSDPEDQNGHGTHVAGTIGGTNYGVANQVTLHAVKVFGVEGSTTDSMVIEAIDWVTARHLEAPTVPRVANMSLGGSFSQALNDAVQNSIATGVTYTISAGNNGNGGLLPPDSCATSPSSTPNAITVGATDLFDNKAGFSSFGKCVDVFAPGVRVLSAWHTSDTETLRLDGTSMSAPHLAGVAALYLGLRPTATPAEVSSVLIARSTRGAVLNPGAGSPNRLIYMAQLVGGSDTQVPTAQITSPAANGSVTGLVNVTASASDNVGVTAVDLFVNGVFESSDHTAPYSLPLDTLTLSDTEPQQLTVRAYDANGNVGTSSVVNVNVVHEFNPPIVTLTAPTNGGQVGAATTLRATATDPSGVQHVQFVVDDEILATVQTPTSGSTYEFSWDGRNVAPGAHTIRAQAIDRRSMLGQSSTLNFTVFVDSTLPTVSLTAPASGASVTGTVNITANASDDRGIITAVDFLVAGHVVCTDTTAPYSCSWNTRPEGNGLVALQAKAVDPFGNVGRSATRNVTVTGSPTAAFNATFQAPACTSVGSSCSSGRLTDGQGSIEPNRPNTLGASCADGASMGRYHFDESVDRLYVTTLDGTNLAPGKRVRVETKAYLLSEADQVDIYHAPNASSPVWTHVATLGRTGSVHETVTLSAEFNLPTSGGASLQAVRANLRAFGAQEPCTAGSFNDRDDLVFSVSTTQPLTVDAGPNRAITQITTAALDGTVTGATSTAWTKVSGPGTVTFGSASQVDTTAGFSAIGSYVLRLTANSGSSSVNDTMTTTVNPEAGPDRTVTLPAAASLDGTAPAVGTVTYTWSKVSGPGNVAFANASAVDTTATFSAAGSYVLRLQAVNGSFTGSDTMNVTASAASARPCASVCSNPVVFSSANFHSGNLGTGATCHETTTSPSILNCGNFAANRTFHINGQLRTCAFQDIPLSPIPKVNGGYCFTASAGNEPWAYFLTF